jgi:tetratricopeptide (TPR) repeat protein
VARHLQTLSGQELTPLERRDPEPEYGFRHALMQEVAYQSMSFASRATLHEQLADYVETRYADDRGAYLDVLAYHYGRSHNQDRQRIYFRLAGDAAAVSYANAAATDYYERLLPLLEAPDQAPVLHRLGEIGHLTGQWETAEAHCRRALVLAEAAGDQRTAAYCRQTIGALLGRTQSYEAAMPWLEQARTAFADLGDTAGLTRTLEQLSFASFQLGDTERALEQAQLHLTIATDSGDALGRSDALAQIGLVAFQRGDSAGALQAHRQARELADQIGYRRRAVLSANDMAGVYWQLGDPAHALEWLLEGLQSADEIGYTWVAGLMIGNAGLLYAQQGEDDRALACLGRSLQTASDLGDGPGVVLALGRLAELLGSQGQTNEAAALCERAVIMARQLGLNYELAEYLALLADLERQRGHDAVALPLCDEAVALAERSEAPEVAIKGRALRERLRLTLGLADTAAACATLETLLTQPDDAAQALIHDTLWQLDATRSHNRDSAAALYRALYAAAPKAEYRARYAALTGEDLPPPPPLPALPPQFAAPPDDLPKLFARVGVGQMMDG